MTDSTTITTPEAGDEDLGDLLLEVLPLRDQTLVNRTGQQGDAVVADLVTEVLAGHADPGAAGGLRTFHTRNSHSSEGAAGGTGAAEVPH